MLTADEIVKFIQNNPILPTIASGGITVWLITNIKNIFHLVVNAITSLISFVIYNNYTDERGFGHNLYERQVAFDRIVSASRPLWERTTNLDLNIGLQEGDIPDSILDANAMDGTESAWSTIQKSTSPTVKTYGFSIRFLLGRLVVVDRHINKNQKITVDTSIRVFFSRKKKFLERLNREIDSITAAELKRRAGGDVVNVFYGSRLWCGVTKKFKRSMDSIFLSNDGHRILLDDISKFISNKPLYQKINYPYKYSALMYGVPGSGKTSTILAIASALGKDVEYINLSAITTTELLDRMNANPKRIFVFEDIDAIRFSANTNRDRNASAMSRQSNSEDENGDDSRNNDFTGGTINLSDLLNITDGLLSSDGTICIFTTNHKERLDPAFLRAGRMNKMVEFRYMDPETARKMVNHHLGVDIEGFKDEIRPAELQEMILDIRVGKRTVEDLKREFCVFG